jgi:hypothetical protein
MKSRPTYIPRIQRKKGKTGSLTNPHAANQNVPQTGQFTAAILGKYGFWRHDYLGLLSLIFKGHPGWKQFARNSAPSGHKEWLIKLQLQLQSLKHPDSYHLSTKKEIIHRLEQQITRLGHNRQLATAGKHPSPAVTPLQTSRSGSKREYSKGLNTQAPLNPGQKELKLISRAATQAANREREAAELIRKELQDPERKQASSNIEQVKIDNTSIDNDNLESTESVHSQNSLDVELSHQLDLPAEQNEVVGNRKDQALQQAAGILQWESDAESRSTFPSIKWANRPGIEISFWGLHGIESKQSVGRIGWALPNMDHPEADLVSSAKQPTRRSLSKVQRRVIRDAEQIFHRHQVLHKELKKPASLAYTSTEPAVNEHSINKRGIAEQDLNKQGKNNQSDIQQNGVKLDSKPASSMKLHSQDQDPTGRMEQVEIKPDNSMLKPPIIEEHKKMVDQTQSELSLNKQPNDLHIQPILQRTAAHFANSTGLAARRNSGLRVVQFDHGRNSRPSQRMHNSQLAINAFEGGSRKLGANWAEESTGTMLASSSFQKLIETKAVDSISQPKIQRRSNLRSQDRVALQDQAKRDQSSKFSLQAETTSLHKAISRRNAPVLLNNKHITEYVESAMELKQPLLQRRNGSSSATIGSQREFPSAQQMQRSRQGAAAGSAVPELISEGIMAVIQQHAAAKQIQFNSTDQLLQAKATNQIVQSPTADHQIRTNSVGQSTQQYASARQFRSRSSSQQNQSRTASEEAGYAHVDPARYISGPISHKLGLSPFTFGASPPAQRIFRKLSEEQMFMQEPKNEYLRKQHHFGRPDDKLVSRIKAKEDAAPSGTQSQMPTQFQSVKYNELASMSFYQAKRRNPSDVSFSQPISSITTNYPNYESAKQFAEHFQKPSARMGSRRPKDWQTEQQTHLTQLIRAFKVTKGSQTDRPLDPKQISSTEPTAVNREILSERADLSVIESIKSRMSSLQQTHRSWPNAKSAERQTNLASTSSIQKRNKSLGAMKQRSISQTALNSPKLISSIGIQRKTEAIGTPREGAISNTRSQSETDGLSPAPVQMLLNYVQDNQTILEHKPGAEASASELSNQPLEMDWLRLNQAEEPTPAETRPVEQPAPQLDMDQLKDLVKKLPQFDIKKIADRVYREIEKKIQFDRQRRGI